MTSPFLSYKVDSIAGSKVSRRSSEGKSLDK